MLVNRQAHPGRPAPRCRVRSGLDEEESKKSKDRILWIGVNVSIWTDKRMICNLVLLLELEIDLRR